MIPAPIERDGCADVKAGPLTTPQARIGTFDPYRKTYNADRNERSDR